MNLTIRTEFDEAAACQLYELDVGELKRRFGQAPPAGHWFAYEEQGGAVGVAVAAERPDGRVFLTHRLRAAVAFAPLLRHALGAMVGRVHVTVHDDQRDRLGHVQTLGLRRELTSISYEVGFDQLLATLPTPTRATNFSVVQVNDVDADRLYALDTELRGDVPGNDGWRGNRGWFDDELGSSECDPSGFLVARDSETDELIGLCRMWRNGDRPSLGMLGVRRERRHGFVALRLLHDTLMAARGWGSPTFVTHTARGGLQRRLQRAGAARAGGFHRFVRP